MPIIAFILSVVAVVTFWFNFMLGSLQDLSFKCHKKQFKCDLKNKAAEKNRLDSSKPKKTSKKKKADPLKDVELQ